MTRMDAWLKAAVDDAEGRGVPALRPLLESLARSTARLRAGAWNERVASRLGEAPDAASLTRGGEK